MRICSLWVFCIGNFLTICLKWRVPVMTVRINKTISVLKLGPLGQMLCLPKNCALFSSGSFYFKSKFPSVWPNTKKIAKKTKQIILTFSSETLGLNWVEWFVLTFSKTDQELTNRSWLMRKIYRVLSVKISWLAESKKRRKSWARDLTPK